MEDSEVVEQISARVSFFEASLSQLKKDIPKYIRTQAESKHSHGQLPKCLKAVASSEPHSSLQYFLFLYARKQEELALEHERFTDLERESKEMLDSWDKLLVQPMKVLVQDHSNGLKKKKKRPVKTSSITLTAAPTAVEELNAPPVVRSGLEPLEAVLPLHARLFEKHRLQRMKQLFERLLWHEIGYHAHCVEAYSALLECLRAVDESDDLQAAAESAVV